MVENEDYIEDVLPRFRKYIGDRTIIAHNAKFDLKFLNYYLKELKYIGDRTIIAHNAKFDLKFLNYYLKELNLDPIENHICTLELLKKNKSYKGKNKKLETACAYYNIENKNAHRADSDTLAIENHICTLELLKKNKSYKGKNKKLETACAYYNIENKNAHRADSDTLATAKLFLKIRNEI